jgi:hypothetical protein
MIMGKRVRMYVKRAIKKKVVRANGIRSCILNGLICMFVPCPSRKAGEVAQVPSAVELTGIFLKTYPPCEMLIIVQTCRPSSWGELRMSKPCSNDEASYQYPALYFHPILYDYQYLAYTYKCTF